MITKGKLPYLFQFGRIHNGNAASGRRMGNVKLFGLGPFEDLAGFGKELEAGEGNLLIRPYLLGG